MVEQADRKEFDYPCLYCALHETSSILVGTCELYFSVTVDNKEFCTMSGNWMSDSGLQPQIC